MPIIHRHRLNDLAQVVDPIHLTKVWKDTVRPGLRRQRFPDLHDHLDIHRHLAVFIKNLREDVLSGAYQPRKPDVATTEKGKGLRRHLVVPSAADALLLQAITDRFEKRLLRGRPSLNAYYTRSHRRPNVENLESNVTYPWWVKWKQFITTILRFRRDFPYLVVTDITNYFDNIDTVVLRNRMVSVANLNLAEVDLLLYILDHLKPRSFYGSGSQIGIPQIDFDAPRLLATVYLYEADELLRRRTRNHFVRWMDDIDFAVKSPHDAHELLGELDHRLQGLNVRLNAGKTRVLTRQEAEKHFWITENIRLNQCKDRLGRWAKKRHTKRWRTCVIGFEKKARGFLQRIRRKEARLGNWDKVYGRYLQISAFTGSLVMESALREAVLSEPALRSKGLDYLRSLGYSPTRLTTLKRLISTKGNSDPCACFDAAEIAAQWEVPARPLDQKRIRLLIGAAERLIPKSGTALFVTGLMLCAKYVAPIPLAQYIRKHHTKWRHSTWALRQVAACLPLLAKADADWIATRVIESGASDAVRVIASLRDLRFVRTLTGDAQLRKYVEWRDKPPYGYSLSRFLVVVRVLTGDLAMPEKQALLNHLLVQIRDEVFHKRLKDVGISQGLVVPP